MMHSVSFEAFGITEEVRQIVQRMLNDAGFINVPFQLRASEETEDLRLNDEEVSCAIEALKLVHTPERLHHEVREPARSAIIKLGKIRTLRSKDSRERLDFLASLTDEEIALIRGTRAKARI